MRGRQDEVQHPVNTHRSVFFTMSDNNPLANAAWEAITQERTKGGDAYNLTSDQAAKQYHGQIKSKTGSCNFASHT